MGKGIAQVALESGFSVWLYDPQAAALERARTDLDNEWQRALAKGRMQQDPALILQRLQTSTQLEALPAVAWIIEAAPEILELKQKLLRQAQALCPGSILASNTSTLPISSIAAGLTSPERLVGLHFFNPVPRMRLVEVIAGLRSEDALVQSTMQLAQDLGKTPVKVQDSPGFLVNRVARPFYGEALRLAAEGVPRQHIDWIARGMGFPMGPFELMDLIGLDINLAASRSVYEAFFGEPRYRPHPSQAQRVAAGMLGRKSGAGWYSYPPGPQGLPNAPTKGPGPQAFIVGQNSLAEALRETLSHTTNVSQAQLVLDCRIELSRKHDFWPDKPVATLCWGHSAALAQHYPSQAVGFSLVPPLNDTSTVELLVNKPNAASELAQTYFESQGLRTLVVPDQAGGVGFRLVALLVNEAVSALAEQVSSPQELDLAMRLGTGYPRGPLAWGHLIGWPQVLAGLNGLFDELGEDRYRPHPLLRRWVATGVTP